MVEPLGLQVKHDGSVDNLLLGWLEHVNFVAESIIFEQLLESGQLNAEALLQRFSSPCLEVEVSHAGRALSNTSEWVFPLKLLGHPYNNSSLAFSHGIGRE